MATEGEKEAVKTYVEQTKLLVTLASAFLFAPAGLVGILKDKGGAGLTEKALGWFVAAELALIISVLMGYLVLATITGSLAEDRFDVYRCATRTSALLQFISYMAGLFIFMIFAIKIVG